MTDLFAALGLMLAIEGLFLAAFPDTWRRAVSVVLHMPETSLRLTGVVLGALGVAVVFLVRAGLR